jgi:hypothetical protein
MTRRNRSKTVLSLAAVAVVGLVCTAQHADAATILTGLGSKNAAVPSDHGSNEPGTPNVALAWTGNWDQYPSWDGRGDVYQIDNSSAANPHKIDLTPDAGWDVTIVSFDLDEWVGGGDTTVDWSIVGSASGALASGTWNDFNTLNDPGNAGGRSTITPNVTGAGGEVLTLSFGQTAGDKTYVAMDNLSFDQVPEPASLALLGMGGLMIACRRRKR